MPKVGRAMKMCQFQKHGTKIIATLLVVSGVGGSTVILSPTHGQTEVAVEQRPAADAAASTPAPIPVTPPAAPAPPVVTIEPPLVVHKDSKAQDIVKAIVGHGRVAGLSEEQITTVIATAMIESSFRPTVSGGVQPYGGRGTAADEVIGLFQEKASFGTVAERQDPNTAITRFIARFLEAYKKHGIAGDHVQAATLAQNPQLRKHNRGVGTRYYRTIQAAMGAAADLHRQAVSTPAPPVA